MVRVRGVWCVVWARSMCTFGWRTAKQRKATRGKKGTRTAHSPTGASTTTPRNATYTRTCVRVCAKCVVRCARSGGWQMSRAVNAPRPRGISASGGGLLGFSGPRLSGLAMATGPPTLDMGGVLPKWGGLRPWSAWRDHAPRRGHQCLLARGLSRHEQKAKHPAPGAPAAGCGALAACDVPARMAQRRGWRGEQRVRVDTARGCPPVNKRTLVVFMGGASSIKQKKPS